MDCREAYREIAEYVPEVEVVGIDMTQAMLDELFLFGKPPYT